MGLLFGLCWLSQCIEWALPFPFPASVLALTLLLVLLLTGLLRVEQVREKADFLLSNLPFFFIPVAVGILQYVDLIRSNALAFVTVCVVSMVVTFGATVWAVRLSLKWMERGKKK